MRLLDRFYPEWRTRHPAVIARSVRFPGLTIPVTMERLCGQRCPTTAALGLTARIPASEIRHDDRLNVGTPRAEWYASSHSLGSERLREWYTSRVHVAPQQYAIRSMSSGISTPSREVAHASTEFRRFWGMSGTPPAYISDGRVRNLGRPSVGCRPDRPHPRRSRVSTPRVKRPGAGSLPSCGRDWFSVGSASPSPPVVDPLRGSACSAARRRCTGETPRIDRLDAPPGMKTGAFGGDGTGPRHADHWVKRPVVGMTWGAAGVFTAGVPRSTHPLALRERGDPLVSLDRNTMLVQWSFAAGAGTRTQS
jgi:hypothetical protein